MSMTIDCQGCGRVRVPFPYAYCPKCNEARTKQAEIDAPRTLRANRLERLRERLDTTFIETTEHHQVLLDLIDIVEELNEHS